MEKWGSGKRDHLAWTIMALAFERRSLIISVDFEHRILNIFHVNRRWYLLCCFRKTLDFLLSWLGLSLSLSLSLLHRFLLLIMGALHLQSHSSLFLWNYEVSLRVFSSLNLLLRVSDLSSRMSNNPPKIKTFLVMICSIQRLQFKIQASQLRSC
jgi:hypothetical protein